MRTIIMEQKIHLLELILTMVKYLIGSKLGNGVKLKTPPGHIPLNVEIDGYKNWLKAIFVSPSIFYSGNPCNSD